MKPSSLIPHKKRCLTPSIIPRFPPFAFCTHPQIILVHARKRCHGGGIKAFAKLGLRKPFFLFSSPDHVKLNPRSIRECYLGRHNARIRGIKRVK